MIFGSTRRSGLKRRSTPDRRSTATGSLASRRSLCLRSAFREGATRPISSGRIQFIQCSPMRKAGRASPTHPGIQVFTRVKFVNSAGKCQGQSDKKGGLAADLPVGPLNGDDAGCAGRAVHASESGVPGTRCAGGGGAVDGRAVNPSSQSLGAFIQLDDAAAASINPIEQSGA